MDAFWNTIRRRRRSIQAKTTLLPSSFSNHYRGIMSCNDEVCVSSNDTKIRERVHEVHSIYINMQFTQHVSSDDVDKLINNLHRGCSPGMDGISSEHLIYGHSDKLLYCGWEVHASPHFSNQSLTWKYDLLAWTFHLLTWEFNMLTWEFHLLTSKLYLLFRKM